LKQVDELNLFKKFIVEQGYSLVVVKNGFVLHKTRGEGLKPFLEAIDKLQHKIHYSTVLDKILGKASALLCLHSKAEKVYALSATVEAKNILKKRGVTVYVSETVDHVKNRAGDGLCPFEKLLENIDSPEQAYNILKKKVYGWI